MPANDLALFRAWPALRERLPRHPFIDEPTPVEAFVVEGVPAGRAFVKRDDLSCRQYGGNKPRKLEFVIGRALERRAKRLVTTGGIGSHHGLATTILGRAAGLETTLVLVPQPDTPEVRETLALDASFGAEIVRVRGVVGAAAKTAAILVRSTLRGERPFLVWTGGSSTLGNVGHVSAALELAEQVRAGVLPCPAEIDVAIGTGGTIAGLVLGLALAKLDVRVRGALVTDILPPSARQLARMANATLSLLRRLEPAIPALTISAADFTIDASELGAGYGAPTASGRAACEAAAEQGIRLETTYTAKCLAALLARARVGALPDGPILFWNTYNSVALRAPVDAVG
jgi:D-cysteine desulfhydrase